MVVPATAGRSTATELLPLSSVCSFGKRFIQCSLRYVEDIHSVMQQKAHFDVFSSRNRKQQ